MVPTCRGRHIDCRRSTWPTTAGLDLKFASFALAVIFIHTVILLNPSDKLPPFTPVLRATLTR